MAAFLSVVGWLVCVAGTDRGKPFPITKGNNSIGRGYDFDIRFPKNDAVSKEASATAIYDPEEKQFLISARNARDLIRVNGHLLPVAQVTELSPYDRIKITDTTLVFIPFCGEKFSWEDEHPDEADESTSPDTLDALNITK